MNDITTEQKLELVQKMRSQYGKNQYDMSNRERVLYGQSRSFAVCNEGTDKEEAVSCFGFKLRIFAAAALLAAVVVLDKNDIQVAGLAMEKIFTAISADYYGVVSEYVRQTMQSFSEVPIL